MSKLLLALSILSASACGFLAARRSAVEFQHEANAAHDSWQMETQQVAVAQSQRISLKTYVEDLRRSLRQRPVVVENKVWSQLQTNLTGQLSEELREDLLRELAFNWQSSPDFIVITKQALRETGPEWIIRNGECTDEAATIFTMTPGEHAQVEAALKRMKTEFNNWAREHVERYGPYGDTVAAYSVPVNPSIGTNFMAAVSQALGANRAEFFLNSVHPGSIAVTQPSPTYLSIDRSRAGNEIRLEAYSYPWPDGGLGWRDLWDNARGDLVPFPEDFRAIFPNGWADVAEREGFELPKGPPKD